MSMTAKQLNKVQPVIKMYLRGDVNLAKKRLTKLSRLELVLCLTNTHEVQYMNRVEKIKFEDFIINCLNS